jgi:hypothetical protein
MESHHEMEEAIDLVFLALSQLDLDCERRRVNRLMPSDADVYRAASLWSTELHPTRRIASAMFTCLEETF